MTKPDREKIKRAIILLSEVAISAKQNDYAADTIVTWTNDGSGRKGKAYISFSLVLSSPDPSFETRIIKEGRLNPKAPSGN